MLLQSTLCALMSILESGDALTGLERENCDIALDEMYFLIQSIILPEMQNYFLYQMMLQFPIIQHHQIHYEQ